MQPVVMQFVLLCLYSRNLPLDYSYSKKAHRYQTVPMRCIGLRVEGSDCRATNVVFVVDLKDVVLITCDARGRTQFSDGDL